MVFFFSVDGLSGALFTIAYAHRVSTVFRQSVFILSVCNSGYESYNPFKTVRLWYVSNYNLLKTVNFQTLHTSTRFCFPEKDNYK